jgi:superfamily I DNA/RNA helicase/RecB family exonuclease
MADVLGTLNDEQRAAVVHDSGPLMVLAGPGTGKTRVIAHRIAHLMTARDDGGRGVDPERIVAVTYTTKAAAQLRERLRELVGPEADRVHAHTFHGLGFRVLRRFGDEIGVWVPAFGENGGGGGGGVGGILDSAQQRRSLREIVVEHGLFAHARAEGLDTVADRLISIAATLSDSGLTPADAARFAAEAAGCVRRGENALGRTLDAEALAAEQARVAELAEAASALGLFEKVCRERGWLSFGDLITLPIRVLREGRHAAAILRDEWRHMVVDEFQDVNSAQIELLRLLMPPAGQSLSGRSPDLCVVGDDDQSIYAFRGADDLAFERFARTWVGCEQIELAKNYRCAPPIVAVANATIARAEGRFAPEKRIEPAGRAEGASAPVECIRLEDDKQDGEVIAGALVAARAEDKNRSWRDFAVVCRSHGDADRVRAALEIEGIPCLTAREGTPLSDEGVRDVLAWVELLADPYCAYAAARIVRRPPFSMGPAAVRGLVGKYRAWWSRFQGGDPGSSDPGGLADWLAAAAPEDAIAARFAASHSALRAEAIAISASELVERIIAHADAAHADLLSGRERAVRVASLVALVRFVRDRQARLEPPGDVRAFWSYWQDLAEGERGLRAGDLGDRIDGIGAPDEDDRPDKVRVITAHSAKGLEFHTVFVPRVSPGHGYGAAREPEGGELPAGLIRGEDERTPKQRARAEQRRLFYVACTRAERRLTLLAKKNKTRSKSEHFFEEIAHDDTLKSFVSVREGADILNQAARIGMKRTAGWDGGALGGSAPAFKDAQRRCEAFEEARRQVRTAAASALDAAGAPGRSTKELEQAAGALRESALQLGALADAERTGAVPPWAAGTPAGEAVSRVLERAGGGSGESGSAREVGWPGLRSPLSLSYTAVEKYLECPRCFYLIHVLGLRPLPGPAQIVGIAVHEGLEKFYRQVQIGESEGGARPNRARLVELGREAFFRHWPRQLELDRRQLDQVTAQLGMAFDRLHDPGANVLETEKRVLFAYGPHQFEAKLDRIDQFTGGDGRVAFRIVDYKTGRSRTALSAPKADDLQLGVYALALAHLYGLGDPRENPPSGVAEYWTLSTGVRGVIDLGKIDYAAIHATIDGAVAGMLAGAWERGKGCKGECDMLGASSPGVGAGAGA